MSAGESMREQTRRIDGWKAIGAYIGRDRSTVIRWSKMRGLPVHAVPGSTGNRTVYAIVEELDAWMLGRGTGAASRAPSTVDLDMSDNDPATAIDAKLPVKATLSGIGRAMQQPSAIVSGVLLAIGAIMLCMLSAKHPASARANDAALLQAHDLVAERSARSLSSAIRLLRRLSNAFPYDARPDAMLAEAVLLEREFGTTSDPAAFATAREASERALRRDPMAATAWRSLGYVHYWGDHRSIEAGQDFRKALRLAPADPLAHLWYANALADLGSDDAAAREMAIARSLNPGQPYMLADAAWARWISGHSGEARSTLERLAVDHPEVASVDDCLSVVLLSMGDLDGYARHLKRRADNRAAPAIKAYSRSIDGALARHDRKELYHLVFAHAMNVADATVQGDHSFATFVAAIFGDQAQVEALVKTAIANGERWGSAGYRRRIIKRWPRGDILAAEIDRLAMPNLSE